MKVLRAMFIVVAALAAIRMAVEFLPEEGIASLGERLQAAMGYGGGRMGGGSEAGESDGDAGGRDDDEDEAAPGRAIRVEGAIGVRLSADEQRETGIRVEALVASQHVTEIPAAGVVLDVQPLVALRSEFNRLHAEVEAAWSATGASRQMLERLRLLRREDANVTARQLMEAEAVATADRNRLSAAELRLRDVRGEAIQRWGVALSAMALAEETEPFDRIARHEDLLVLVTLRPGETLPVAGGTVYVGPTGQRERARPAELIAPATETDAVVQGETYYFRTAAEHLRIGMRLDVWIPAGAQPRRGVEVPGSAVIWHADRPWVYVRTGADLFVRKMLTGHEETRDGWFVGEGLGAGDEIVVAGAQMLYSEEFRARIPDEDEK